MTITQTLSLKDFKEASLRILLNKMVVKIVLTLFVLGMILFPIGYGIYTGNYQELVSPILFSIILVVLFNLTYNRAFKSNPDLQEAMTFNFGKNKIEIRGQTGRTEIKLPMKALLEFNNFFAFQVGPQVYYILKKEGLDDDQVEKIRKIQ